MSVRRRLERLEERLKPPEGQGCPVCGTPSTVTLKRRVFAVLDPDGPPGPRLWTCPACGWASATIELEDRAQPAGDDVAEVRP